MFVLLVDNEGNWNSKVVDHEVQDLLYRSLQIIRFSICLLLADDKDDSINPGHLVVPKVRQPPRKVPDVKIELICILPPEITECIHLNSPLLWTK